MYNDDIVIVVRINKIKKLMLILYSLEGITLITIIIIILFCIQNCMLCYPQYDIEMRGALIRVDLFALLHHMFI